MKTNAKDVMRYTLKDYAEDLRQLIEQEQEYTTRILQRIDESMDVIFRTDRLLKK